MVNPPQNISLFITYIEIWKGKQRPSLGGQDGKLHRGVPEIAFIMTPQFNENVLKVAVNL